jgi:predicted nucleotidyltransferase
MSIASSLFSASQERVFRWLFGQPERSYHLSELRRLTGLGSASLQRELNRLAESGLVTSERVGNLRRFQANPQSPVFNELVNLTRKTMGAEPLLREALQPLKRQLKSAWIYGSVAKQTDKAGSDIDVMLVGDKIRMEKILKVLLPLEDQLGRKISPTCYTPAEFAKRRAQPDSFVNRVLAQPVIPLLGDTIEPARSR